MPSLKEHCAKSKELFGEDGKKYHQWLDQYSKYGYSHRCIFHNREGLEQGVILFGEVARKHLEQHLKDDLQLRDIGELQSIMDILPYKFPEGLINHEPININRSLCGECGIRRFPNFNKELLIGITIHKGLCPDCEKVTWLVPLIDWQGRGD